MVISKKRDFRTRKKRETFFGLPFFPLIIFLILVIFLLLVSIPKVSREKELISEVSKEKFKKTTEIPITGEVISGLNLTKINYNTNEPLQGNFNLRFYVGDLIPVTSNVSFKISGIKCNYFYVCGDGQTLAPWEFYNITAGRCQNVSGYWQNNPWHDFCGENYNVYPNANSAINCTSLGGKCCEPGNGIGYFYPNLNCSNKECWDDCATKQIIDLKTFVSRSTTPTKGNFSYGQANNVNGSEPNVASFGFSYCSNTSEGSVGNVGGIFGRLGGVASGTGYIIRGQPAQPDLTVARIEIQESTPPIGTTGAIKKIYARIRNSGMGTASNFVVRAEWNSIPYMPIIGNYKEETVSYLGPGQEYSFYVNDLNAIENLELTVTADYYNSVSESNEGNNEKKTFLGCLDTDGGNNKEEKGKCYDFSEQYYYEDYCEIGTTEIYLNEYVCNTPNYPWPFDRVCSINQVYCDYGCEDGKCLSGIIQPWCNDTDNGNPMIGGSCTDSQGNGGFDECINGTFLREWNCEGFNWPQCIYNDLNCEEIIGQGSRCEIDLISGYGKCTQPLQIQKADLIIEKIERTSDMRRVLIWIRNQGDQIANGPFNISLNITGEINAFEILTFNSNLEAGRNGSIVGQTNIEARAVYAKAFVDYPRPGVVDEFNEDNNEMNVYLSPYSCYNWTNFYIVPIGNYGLNLKAPTEEGNYYLNVSLYYNSSSTGFVEMSRDAAVFVARKPVVYYYKGCQDNRCIIKNSTTPRNDSCDSDSDCIEAGIGCNEDWKFKDLTGCVNKQRKLECYDVKNCGTDEELPPGCVYDPLFKKYLKIESCCESSWQCDSWSVCYKYQDSSVQSMTCRDINNCNPQNSTYVELRDCCVEEWNCNWGACIDGKQKLVCQEMAGCGTEFTKPKEEIRACGKAVIAWWIWLVIVIVIVIVTLVVLFATRVIKLPKVKKKEAQEEKFAEKIKLAESPELINYIKSALAAGMSKEEIKKKLIEAGWPADIVDSALVKV